VGFCTVPVGLIVPPEAMESVGRGEAERVAPLDRDSGEVLEGRGEEDRDEEYETLGLVEGESVPGITVGV